MYLGRGCKSTLTCRDRAKYSMTFRSSCVNCSGDSSGVKVGVSRAGDGAGETGQAGGDGGDVSDDDAGSGGDGDGGGGGSVKGTRCPARA